MEERSKFESNKRQKRKRIKKDRKMAGKKGRSWLVKAAAKDANSDDDSALNEDGTERHHNYDKRRRESLKTIVWDKAKRQTDDNQDDK